MEREQSFKEFVQSIKGPKGKQKVSNSWGIYDAYKLVRKNHWYSIGRPLKEHEFYTIIRSINKALADNLALGDSVTFPAKMGKLGLIKYPKGVFMVKGKLVNTYPIDWPKTYRLWYEDEEAFKDKIVLRDEQSYVYHIKYFKKDATYNNQLFYQFTLNTFIRWKLKDNIISGKIDALWA